MSSPFEFPQRLGDGPHGIYETLWHECNRHFVG